LAKAKKLRLILRKKEPFLVVWTFAGKMVILVSG
jgi:hypothetical protein